MEKNNKFHNETIETMGSEELRSLQEEKLTKQMQYVYKKSKFYQRKFKEVGLVPEDIRSIQDLKKVPFTTKDELRESQEKNPPLGSHAAVNMRKIIRIHSSSGTTGNPSFVGITHRDQKGWTEITERSIYTWGIRPKDVVIHAVGLTLFVGGLPVKDAIEHLGATFVPIGPGASERVIYNPTLQANVVHCTPSYDYFQILRRTIWIRENWVFERLFVEPRWEGVSLPSEKGLKKIMTASSPKGWETQMRLRLYLESA
jgi:phenylacetate-CoA ligase